MLFFWGEQIMCVVGNTLIAGQQTLKKIKVRVCIKKGQVDMPTKKVPANMLQQKLPTQALYL